MLQDELKTEQRRNQELVRRLAGQQKVTIEQAKALEKIEDENSYHARFKGLMDELRIERDKNGKLREANRNLDKNSKMQVERMVKMQTELRELRAGRKKTDERRAEEDLKLTEDKLDELSRATALLAKTKETD